MDKIIKYSSFFESNEQQREDFVAGSMKSIDPVIKAVMFFNKKVDPKQESLDDVVKVLEEYDFESRVSYDDNDTTIRINLNDKTTTSFISIALDKLDKSLRIDYKLDKDIEGVNNYIDYIEVKFTPDELKKTLENFEKIRVGIKPKRK